MKCYFNSSGKLVIESQDMAECIAFRHLMNLAKKQEPDISYDRGETEHPTGFVGSKSKDPMASFTIDFDKEIQKNNK